MKAAAKISLEIASALIKGETVKKVK